MSKNIQVFVMLIALTFLAVTQGRCGNCSEVESQAKAATSDVEQCEEGTCPIAAAMENLPKITFAVGDETLTCAKSAATLAQESGGKLRYCVGDGMFDAEADAQAALVEATEKYVSTFAEPRTCKTSGKITVAGNELHCIFCARSLAKKVNAAMGDVQMTYMVGGEQCSCPDAAAKLAKSTGVDKQFVVGEETTCCEQTARLNLARAKYKAAIAFLAEANAKKDAPEKSQGT